MRYQVEKRDGRLVNFEIGKIRRAIQRAFDAQSVNYDNSVLDLLAREQQLNLSLMLIKAL